MAKSKTTPKAEAPEKPEVLPLSKIQPSSYNPNTMTAEEFEFLKESLKANGQLYPVLVASMPGGKWSIVDGNHRHRAAEELGWTELWVEKNQLSKEERRILAVRLNKHRGRLDPTKVKQIFKEMEALGLSQKDIAKKFGYDKSTVSAYLSIDEDALTIASVKPELAAQTPVRALYEASKLPTEKRAVALDKFYANGAPPSTSEALRIVALEKLDDQFREIAHTVPEMRQVEFAQWVNKSNPDIPTAEKVARLTRHNETWGIQRILDTISEAAQVIEAPEVEAPVRLYFFKCQQCGQVHSRERGQDWKKATGQEVKLYEEQEAKGAE